MDNDVNKEDCTELSTSIYTYNVRGLRDTLKRGRLFTYIKSNMCGIIFLQETHSVHGDLEKWKKEWQGEMFLSSGTSQSKGVAILISPNIDCTIEKTEIDQEGRYIMLTGIFNGHKLSLVNIYAPTADKKTEQIKFLDQIITLLENNSEKLILAGDLNTHLQPEDKYGVSYIKTEFATKLLDTMNEYGLTDIWRVNNPDSKRYTWRKKMKNGLAQSRLDYFLISESLTYSTTKCDILHALYSDHNPVHLQLSSETQNNRGRGFWKLNTSLLHDKNYIHLINQTLDDELVRHNTMNDKGLKWDTLKMLVRSTTINYASNKARETKRYEEYIKKELNDITEKLEQKADDDLQQQYTTNVKELEIINNQKARGHQIRARAMHIEFNEKNSKYFLKKETIRAEVKNITTIDLDDGTKITGQTNVIKCQKEYYETLYTQPKPKNTWQLEESEDFFLNENNIPQLTENEKDILDSELTEHEIAKAVKNLPNSRAPGSDGIPIDFYKMFWTKSRNPYAKALNTL